MIDQPHFMDGEAEARDSVIVLPGSGNGAA